MKIDLFNAEKNMDQMNMLYMTGRHNTKLYRNAFAKTIVKSLVQGVVIGTVCSLAIVGLGALITASPNLDNE